jgi:S-adenosylmethionine:tRNA ribosyltransferase-isomerase
MTVDVARPAVREAREPPEARGSGRDDVALMISRRGTGEISHHAFARLPQLLLPGDLIVINTSATLPAAVRVRRVRTGPAGPGDLTGHGSAARPDGLTVHFSTALPDGDWLVELRAPHGTSTTPFRGGSAGQRLELPAGAVLTLGARFTRRLWRARMSTAVIPYLLRHGEPIRYSYVDRPWPIESYQTAFGIRPGSAEMPSASRPFTPQIVTRLVTRGITFAPLTLHTGVSSLEDNEEPYPEPYDVPPATARLVNLTRRSGGRVIAAGTTVVRALETAARAADALAAGHAGGIAAAVAADASDARHAGDIVASAGWTDHVVTPERGLRAVDGLLTGLHEPASSHLRMLAAFAGQDLLARCYAAAIERGYRWHEFGDLHLLLS